MPYSKFFISEEKWPKTVVLPLPDDFPDPRVITEYLEMPGALVVIADGKLGKRGAENAMRDKVDDIHAHIGQVGALLEGGKVVWGKVVPCRVSTEALVEWLSDSRDRNRGIYPDRPPDVDTATLRTWIEHPVEIGDGAHIAGSAMKPSDVADRFPVYTCTVARASGQIVKVLVSWWAYKSIPADELPLSLVGKEGGAYHLRIKEEAEEVNDVILDVEVLAPDDDETFWDRVETMLEAVGSVRRPTADPLISTYTDFAEIFDQGDLAVSEMHAYYEAEMLRRPDQGMAKA